MLHLVHLVVLQHVDWNLPQCGEGEVLTRNFGYFITRTLVLVLLVLFVLLVLLVLLVLCCCYCCCCRRCCCGGGGGRRRPHPITTDRHSARNFEQTILVIQHKPCFC